MQIDEKIKKIKEKIKGALCNDGIGKEGHERLNYVLSVGKNVPGFADFNSKELYFGMLKTEYERFIKK